jgi:hypothetical protein
MTTRRYAFAARGPLAARITQPHPVDIPHGLDSPPARGSAAPRHAPGACGECDAARAGAAA